jgi:cysteine desulfurase/selenocysteine lyase
MLNINQIRSQFACLADEKTLYFDSACQSLRPNSVLDAMNGYYRDFPACGERSEHRWGRIVTEKVEEARKKVAKFINAEAEEIIFTKNTTEGINSIARGMGLMTGDVVLISDKEHNSNFLPWINWKNDIGVDLRIIETEEDGSLSSEKIEIGLQLGGVKLVSLAGVSQIDGRMIDVFEITKLAHEAGAKILIDGAQMAAHQPIDVKKLDVDFLAFSGHKVYGPSGTGVLFIKKELQEQIEPLMFGGGTVQSVEISSRQENAEVSPLGVSEVKPLHFPGPEKFEAGLQNYSGILGLGEAVEWLSRLGWKDVLEHEKNLYQKIVGELKELEDVRIFHQNEHASIVSFYVDNLDSKQLAIALDSGFGIAVRAGQFCSHYYFAKYHVPDLVRISLGVYNSESEVQSLVEAVKKTVFVLKK